MATGRYTFNPEIEKSLSTQEKIAAMHMTLAAMPMDKPIQFDLDKQIQSILIRNSDGYWLQGLSYLDEETNQYIAIPQKHLSEFIDELSIEMEISLVELEEHATGLFLKGNTLADFFKNILESKLHSTQLHAAYHEVISPRYPQLESVRYATDSEITDLLCNENFEAIDDSVKVSSFVPIPFENDFLIPQDEINMTDAENDVTDLDIEWAIGFASNSTSATSESAASETSAISTDISNEILFAQFAKEMEEAKNLLGEVCKRAKRTSGSFFVTKIANIEDKTLKEIVNEQYDAVMRELTTLSQKTPRGSLLATSLNKVVGAPPKAATEPVNANKLNSPPSPK